jgi:hypothetical protein
MYGRIPDYTGFYNAVGWVPYANFPPMIWFLIAGISMIRSRDLSSVPKIPPARGL